MIGVVLFQHVDKGRVMEVSRLGGDGSDDGDIHEIETR